MKAAIHDRYGPPGVVRLADLPRPVPKPDEILVRVHAASVSAADWRIRSLNMPRGFGTLGRLMFGWNRPRNSVLGTDLSGEVIEVGSAVTRFRLGDAVVATTGAKAGCHAEFRALKADGAVVTKPKALSHAEAVSLVFGGLTALNFLRDRLKLLAGERLLVVGASGAVGSAAVQIGRAMGAEVTGVTSAANAALVRDLGAVRVIDYTVENPATAGVWDVILDAVGTAPFQRIRPALTPEGRLGRAVTDIGDIGPLLGNLLRRQKVVGGAAPERQADLAQLMDWGAAGVLRPVIDCVLPFEQIVEAHARVDSRRKRGAVVLDISGQAQDRAQ